VRLLCGGALGAPGSMRELPPKAAIESGNLPCRSGAQTAIERFYPNPPHERLHMTAANLAPLGGQQASQL
jgi:hypothetical protein